MIHTNQGHGHGQGQQLLEALLEKRRRQTGGTMDLLTWTILHRRELKPDVPFDLRSHLYLAEMYEQTAKEKVVKKAGQMGASEMAVSDALWSADVRGATVLYVFPTDTHVSDFSTARIGPAVEASPYLSQIVMSANNPLGKRGADRVGLKRVRDRFLYLRGARVASDGSAAQLKSIDADKLYLDELDEMDPRAPIIASKRLGHSLMAETMKISTPSYHNRGIDAAYELSDQRRWFLRCEGCNHWQYLTLAHVVLEQDELERPTAWHGQADGRAYCACEKCGRELNRLAQGVWVATYPARPIVGYHLTKLFSPTADILAIVRTLHSVDQTTRKECFNQDLGEAFTPTGGKLTAAELDACLRDYAAKRVPDERPSMGVDVGSVHHVVIRGEMTEQGERPLRLAVTVGSFDEVIRLIKAYNVRCCVIDGEPEVTKAREVQAAVKSGVVWLADYAPNGMDDVEPLRWNKGKKMVLMDRTRTLDLTLARFREGENTLPANARDIPLYYAQLQAPTRVLGPDFVVRYIEDGADHFAHAENYCTAASLRSKAVLW